MRLSIIPIIIVVSLLLVLTSCSQLPFGNSSNQRANTDFYKGSQGVVMRLTDPSSPPPRMYYFNDANPDDNRFDIAVDVHNEGASLSRGGIYVSGYDPSMIHIDKIEIPRIGGGWGDCITDINFLGGSFGGSFSCADTGVNIFSDASSSGFSVESIGTLLNSFGITNSNSILDNIGLSVEQSSSGVLNFDMNFGDDFNFDYIDGGVGMLLLISGLNFERYNGVEYRLQGDNYDYPGGEQDTIVFNGNVRSWPQGLDKTTVNFMITNCYAYSTYASTEVCIDPAPYDNSIRKVCNQHTINFGGSNGAPIAVTSIEQSGNKKTAYFTINIKNIGDGQVFNLGHLERCSPYYPGRVRANDLNIVYLLDARVAGHQIECSPSRMQGIRLVNGQGSIRCKYNLEYATAKSAYTTPIVLEFGYGYTTAQSRLMTIKRAS